MMVTNIEIIVTGIAYNIQLKYVNESGLAISEQIVHINRMVTAVVRNLLIAIQYDL